MNRCPMRICLVMVVGLISLALPVSPMAPAVGAVPSGPDSAKAGAVLDPSFGVGGLLRLPSGSAFTTLGAAISGGKLLVSGGFKIQILGDRGQPGKAFGDSGSIRSPSAGGNRFQLEGLTVDPKGRLLVLGTSLFPASENPSPHLENGSLAFRPGILRIIRFLPDGQMDPAFGDGGIVETDLGLPPPLGAEGQSLGTHPAIQPTGIATGPEGRIVVTGGSIVRLGESCVHDDFAPVGVGAGFVARFTGDGAPDLGFGKLGLVGGRALSENPLGAETISEPIIGPTGVITYRSTAAYPCEPRQSRLGIGQLIPAGQPRSTFGQDGSLTGPYAALAGGPDGSVVALAEPGRLGRGSFRAEVARIAADGRPDRSFGHGGRTVLTLGPSLFTHLDSLAVDRHGDILVGGTLYVKGKSSAVLLKVSPHGRWEKGFGPRGRVVTKIPDLPYAGPSSLFFDPHGRLMALHLHSMSGHAGLVVARYLLRARN